MMKAGNLGDQVFIQSEKAFNSLIEIDMNQCGYFEIVESSIYKSLYNKRDSEARKYVNQLLNDPSINDFTDTIDKYIK